MQALTPDLGIAQFIDNQLPKAFQTPAMLPVLNTTV